MTAAETDPGIEEVARLEDAIVAYVSGRLAVPFVELQEAMGRQGHDVYGSDELLVPGDPMLVLWPGVDCGFMVAIELALQHNRVFLHPADPFTYFIEGGRPNLPLARRDVTVYTEPHWFPAVLSSRGWSDYQKHRREHPAAWGDEAIPDEEAGS